MDFLKYVSSYVLIYGQQELSSWGGRSIEKEKLEQSSFESFRRYLNLPFLSTFMDSEELIVIDMIEREKSRPIRNQLLLPGGA